MAGPFLRLGAVMAIGAGLLAGLNVWRAGPEQPSSQPSSLLSGLRRHAPQAGSQERPAILTMFAPVRIAALAPGDDARFVAPLQGQLARPATAQPAPAVQPAAAPAQALAARSVADPMTTGSITPVARPDDAVSRLVTPLPVPRPATLKLISPQETRVVPPAPPAQPEKTERPNRRRAAAAVAAPTPAPVDNRSFLEKLFGAKQPGQDSGTRMAYAPAQDDIGSRMRGSGLSVAPASPGVPADLMAAKTAVYDISARMVYLPNGEKLEANSGLGEKMNDLRYVHVRMHGPTPPHIYTLTEREALFHGVRAIRMHPVGGPGRIFGRTGLLVHSYLLGPRGDSNGCVSIKDYDRFLQAFLRGEVKRLVVVSGRG